MISTRDRTVARELRALTRLALMAFLLASAALFQGSVVSHPRARYITADGRAFAPRDLHDGAPLAGNTADDLDRARATAIALAALQFNVNSATLTANVQAVDARGTAHGRTVYRRWLPREMYSALVLADAGAMQVRSYGTGATAVGEAPGRVKVTVPLTGWFYSRHVPFAGPYTGIPLRGAVQWWMQRDAHDDAWRLDSLAGSVLDSSVVELWVRYRVASRPLPAVVVDGKVIAPDSARWASWMAPKPYGRF
ncbi:MAG: hypothetical protein H3C62_00425 [Gemmatimonadaceae bacterium]|nr:hypothetical protein [Gemmatimonadaceae bacterium]